MSETYRATETAFGRPVFVKFLARELIGVDASLRFRQEVSLTASLQHPQIVPLLRAGELDGVPYCVMPFIEGESLKERLMRGPLAPREAANILLDVARALAYAHERGVVHRDIKPGNILLTSGSAMVTDFGIAKVRTAGVSARRPGAGSFSDSASFTAEGVSIGTPAYMAPEQVVADPAADHRVDIYALGIVGYEMIAGSPPFMHRSAAEVRAAHLTQHPRLLRRSRDGVPPRLAELIMHCLAKHPAERPRAASELACRLQAADLLRPEPSENAVLAAGRRASRRIVRFSRTLFR